MRTSRPSVEFLPEAEDDDAVRWLRRQRRDLAIQLIGEVGRAIELIAEHPEAWGYYEGRPPYRHYVIDGLRYIVVYALVGDLIWIVAVAQASRRPGYWRDREVPGLR